MGGIFFCRNCCTEMGGLGHGRIFKGTVGVYYGKNVPLFRRNGYRKPGAMIP